MRDGCHGYGGAPTPSGGGGGSCSRRCIADGDERPRAGGTAPGKVSRAAVPGVLRACRNRLCPARTQDWRAGLCLEGETARAGGGYPSRSQRRELPEPDAESEAGWSGEIRCNSIEQFLLFYPKMSFDRFSGEPVEGHF